MNSRLNQMFDFGGSKLWIALLLVLSVTIQFASKAIGEETAAVNAFKHYLESPPQVREIKFAEVSNGEDAAPAYYVGASDGTNFFVRRYLPTEKLDVPLSPDNLARFPFFGRAAANQWEIAGLNVYQTEESTNPISLLVRNANYMLSDGLALGLSIVRPGTVVWTNDNRFLAKRGGPIPIRSEIRTTINGVEHIQFADPESMSGILYISNGLPARIDCQGVTFYYDFRPKDGLPVGIPSTISTCRFGAPKSEANTVMSIISYVEDEQLKPEDFEPYKYISSHYIGIVNRSNGGENVLKDNAYAVSQYEVESIHKRNSARYQTVRIALGILIIAPLLLALWFRFNKRTKS